VPTMRVDKKYVEGWSGKHFLSEEWSAADVKKRYEAGELLPGGITYDFLHDLRLLISRWEPKTKTEWEMYIRAFNHFLIRPSERGAANAIARMFHPIADRGQPILVRRPRWPRAARRRAIRPPHSPPPSGPVDRGTACCQLQRSPARPRKGSFALYQPYPTVFLALPHGNRILWRFSKCIAHEFPMSMRTAQRRLRIRPGAAISFK
jgi:hypothetical protein